MKKLRKETHKFLELDAQIDLFKAASSFVVQDNTYSHFSDGNSVISEITCLNCSTHPCTQFADEYRLPEILKEMPFNTSMEVCPVGAIKSPGTETYIEINNDVCIGCNLCVNQCHYGALKLDPDGVKVNSSTSNYFKSLEAEQITGEKNIDKLLASLKTVQIFKQISEKNLLQHYSQIEDLIRNNNGLENHLIRNVLNSIGIKSKVRAIGNNDIRFDLIAQFFEKVIVAEISINGNDILELPRAILDDISVVNSRYGIKFEKIIPLIVINKFPNKRSDFYEVLDDIRNITGIETRVITYHLLSILLRSNFKIDPTFFESKFVVGKSNTSILDSALAVLPALKEIDPLLESDFYSAVK